MVQYFTREKAESLLPVITITLHALQESQRQIQSLEEELAALRMQSMGNGHHLRERVVSVQTKLFTQVEEMRSALAELRNLGCELKDIETGLVDFLSLRDGQEVYLCWRLGEERIAYWHHLDAGAAGRQPLD